MLIHMEVLQMNILSENIKYFRKQKKITQKELESLSRIKQSTLTRYENGKLTPRLSTLKTIANSLDIPVELFFTDREKEEEVKFLSDDELEQLEQEYHDYMMSSQYDIDMQNNERYEEIKAEYISDIFYTLHSCRKYLPSKIYDELINELNKTLDDYKKGSNDEITLLLHRIDNLYSELTPSDYSKILSSSQDTLKKYNITKILKNY